MKILVVDDSPAMRKIIRNALEGIGYSPASILEATGGKNAIRMLRAPRSKIDIVLADWNMPDMNGLSLLKELQAVKKLRSIPFIMMASEAQRDRVVEAIRAGARSYVVKPFTPETLREKVLAIEKELLARSKPTDTAMIRFEAAEVTERPDPDLPFLAQLPEKILAGIYDRARRSEHPKDEVLMEPADTVQSLHIVVAGEIEILPSSNGRLSSLQGAAAARTPRTAPGSSTAVGNLPAGRVSAPDRSRAAPVSAPDRESGTYLRREGARRHAAAARPGASARPTDPGPRPLARPTDPGPRAARAVSCPGAGSSGEAPTCAGGESGGPMSAALMTLGRGDCFGELSFLSGDAAGVSARARTKVVVASVERGDFEALLAEHPDLSIYLTRLLAKRARKADAKLTSELEKGLSGRLSTIALAELVQTFHNSCKTGLLRVESCGEAGEIYFVDGNVRHARSGGQTGEEALYELLTWAEGSFTFETGTGRIEHCIFRSTIGLLIEGMCRKDELRMKRA